MTMSKNECESFTEAIKEEPKEKAESSKLQKDSYDKKKDLEKNEKEKNAQISISESSQSTIFHSPRDTSNSNDNHHSSPSERSLPIVLVDQKMITVEDPAKVEAGRSESWDASGYLTLLKLRIRITAFVFCMISFSVLAADKIRGPATSYPFKEYKYSLAINVTGFVYSLLQVFDIVKYKITKKHTFDSQLWRYFTFAMDQILTYLLISATSSAATLAYIEELAWGTSKITKMANVSTFMAFIAFAIFALASLVSGFILCKNS